jgi:glyoxylase-like metal-dependent hydrolase (beta-lactamase superfamily II)
MTTPVNPPTFQPLKITALRENLLLATGGAGANSGILIGRDHVLLIDAKMTAATVHELSQIIQAQVGKSVSKIILTHGDIDHVGGIDAWPEPFVLISHELTRKDIIAQADRISVKHLPDNTFMGKHQLDFEGTAVELIHIGPAHTGADTAVLFPGLRTAFVGDVLFFNREPLIHQHKGGSSAGLIAALDFLLTLDVNAYASGHNDPVGKAEVKQLREAIAQKRERVNLLTAAGRSWEEIKVQLGVKDIPPPPGRPWFPSLVEVIYQEFIEAKAQTGMPPEMAIRTQPFTP